VERYYKDIFLGHDTAWLRKKFPNICASIFIALCDESLDGCVYMTLVGQLEYTNARKEVKVICHRKKKEYEENIFQEIQERYTRNEERKFYEGNS
jgi:hypothetical protein